MKKIDKGGSIEQPGVEGTAESGRRDFLKKAGRFAIYTPPAVMLLMRPSQATVLKSAVGKASNDRDKDKKAKFEKFDKKFDKKVSKSQGKSNSRGKSQGKSKGFDKVVKSNLQGNRFR